jgi:hypothetical protein
VTISDAVFHELPTERRSSAIVNNGFLFAKNLHTTTYTNAIRSRIGERNNVPGPDIPFYVSHEVVHAFPAPHRSLNLDVEETPDAPWDPLDQWASPLAYGGLPNDALDDSGALQQAIDSGATTVYLPNGTWRFAQPVELRGKVRRLIGCEARIAIENLQGRAAFRVVDGVERTVWIEGMDISTPQELFVDHASNRRLVLRSLHEVRAQFSGRGDVFIEDVSGRGLWKFQGNKVWARQLFLDFDGPKIVNEGGQLWIMGLTTRRPGTVINTLKGGRTELLGALCIASGAFKQQPMFIIENASASLVAGELSYEGTPFQTTIMERRGDQSIRLQARTSGDGPRFQSQGGGVAITLYSGFDGPDAKPVRGATPE